jgi:hypothetical protein
MKDNRGLSTMDKVRVRYVAGGLCILLFIAAQTFQELAYLFWIPASHSPEDDLRTHLLPMDQVRAIVILGTVVLLIVPFIVITLRYFRVAPLASILGMVFGTAFIGFELAHRSMDFFVVGAKWAHQLSNVSPGAEHEAILQRFTVWNEIVHGWYFPLMLSYLFASCSFAVATWTDKNRGGWYYLAPIANGLNALRLLGRLLSTFGGQRWLDGLNERFYFPAVLTINVLLVIWFFALTREAGPADA